MNWRKLPKLYPSLLVPEPEAPKFAFCEAATAGGGSRWHIRPLTPRGKMLGGGADTEALCGRQVSWDVKPDVNERQLQGACPICARIYRDKT
jgi:hypothetical protein